jgi:hypothetical protein
MTRIGAAGLLAALLLAAGAGGASSTDHTIQVGSRLFVGVPLTCGVLTIQGKIAINCLERNPKNDEVYGNSLGATLIAGKAGRAAIIYYDKDGNASAVWRHSQPHHRATGLFPTGKRGKDILALPDDRYALGGTNLFCPVSGVTEILCAVVNTKTLTPVPGTYAIDAAENSMEVDQITKGGHFRTIKAYDEPKLKADEARAALSWRRERADAAAGGARARVVVAAAAASLRAGRGARGATRRISRGR